MIYKEHVYDAGVLIFSGGTVTGTQSSEIWNECVAHAIAVSFLIKFLHQKYWISLTILLINTDKYLLVVIR